MRKGKVKVHKKLIYQSYNQHFTRYKGIIFNLTNKKFNYKIMSKMTFDDYTIKQIINELIVLLY